jgi:hypothetical protein
MSNDNWLSLSESISHNKKYDIIRHTKSKVFQLKIHDPDTPIFDVFFTYPEWVEFLELVKKYTDNIENA